MTGTGDTAGIGEAAQRFGVAAHVLRHWEACGLLTPPRDASGRRRYGEDEYARIAAVQLAKEAGLGLDAIRTLVTAPAGGAQRTELLAHRAALRERIARARAELELVECALRCPHDALRDCPNFGALVDQRAGAIPGVGVGVGVGVGHQGATRAERRAARPSGGAGARTRKRVQAATEGEQ